MKRLDVTPDLTTRLTASFGLGVNLDNLAVFEAVCVNQNPLRKQGGVFEGALITPTVMRQMQAQLAQESLPLHLAHFDAGMPQGRVFDSRVVLRGNQVQLVAQFALNTATQASIISDIEAGIVDQVSIQILASSMTCSQCQWDYMGDDADWSNFETTTCGNGHKIGEEGTHLVISQLKKWVELSLVSTGAVQGARIVTPDQSVFGGALERLAASAGDAASQMILVAALEDVNLKPTPAMARVAQQALDWRREFGRGGTPVGVARARDISNRTDLSPETVRRMVSYFARHEVDKNAEGFSSGEDGFPSAGRVAWDLWGGDTGRRWAIRKSAEIENELEASSIEQEEPDTMNTQEMLAAVALHAGAAAAANAELANLRAQLADLEARLSSAQADLDIADTPVISSDDLKLATGVLREQATRMLVATGSTEAPPEDVPALVATVRALSAKLTAAIPVGATSVAADKVITSPKASSMAAFVSRRN